MASQILTVGVDSSAEQFLINEGFGIVHEPEPSVAKLCDLMRDREMDAVLLGMDSPFDGNLVFFMRSQDISLPAVHIQEGPRDKNWSLRCARFLNAGGDDVLVGPSNPEEVVRSLQAVIRRSRKIEHHIVRCEHEGSSIEFDLTDSRLWVNGVPMKLTGYEMRILGIIAAHKGAVRSSTIRNELYHCEDPDGNSTEVLICRMRRKLGTAGSLIVTHKRLSSYELVGRKP